MRQRALLIDDDPFTRTVLVNTIEALGLSVVASVGSAPEAMTVGVQSRPHIAIIDLDLGEGPTGIDVARALRKQLPDLGIVILSTYAHPRLIGHNQSSLPAGSRYVVKSSVVDGSVLGEAIELALSWRAHDRPGSDQHPAQAAFDGLTDLQVDLLRLCAAGYSNAEIARRRHITEASVEKSIHRLMRHLGIKPSKQQSPRVVLAQIYFTATGGVTQRRA